MALTISEANSMRTEKRSEGERMRELVCAVGGPLRPTENRKSWLARVARQAGITARAAKAAFYGEINADNKVAWKLRAAAKCEQSIKLKRLASVLDSAAQALAGENESSDRENVAALIRAARWLRTAASESEVNS